jgi:hypothetical protein
MTSAVTIRQVGGLDDHAGQSAGKAGRLYVIPFFERHPILSEKRLEFETFAEIVRAMERGEHLEHKGFERLLALAVQMNGMADTEELTGHPESSEAIRQTCTAGPVHEEMVRPPWRHGEPGETRNDLAAGPRRGSEVTDVSVPILRGRRRLEEGCP